MQKSVDCTLPSPMLPCESRPAHWRTTSYLRSS